METSVDTPRSINVERLLLVVAALILIPVVITLALERENLLYIYVAAVFACILISFPRACFYLFLISVSIYFPYFIGRVGIHLHLALTA